MRIVHLIHSEGVYGAELVLLYLAREQQRAGHVSLIGSIRDPGTPQTAFEARATHLGLQIIPIRIAPRPTPGVVRAFLRVIAELRPDVLHSHGYKPDILLGFLARRTRGPMVTTLHGWSRAPNFTALWLYEQLDRMAIRQLDIVALVTRQMLDLPAVRRLAPTRRRVIENGIPPLATRLADLATLNVPPLPAELVEFTARRPTLVAIGRLAPVKGFLSLLQAFGLARKRCGASHQLLIVGEGPQRQALTAYIASVQLKDEVRLAGYVQGADRLLSVAAGFVMSSRTEGMPLVLLEAMQWGVPILATAVGAIPDLLDGGRRGILVPPNDLTALVDGLSSMLSSTSATGLADDAARGQECIRFSSARMHEEYLAAYKAAIGEVDCSLGYSRGSSRAL